MKNAADWQMARMRRICRQLSAVLAIRLASFSDLLVIDVAAWNYSVAAVSNPAHGSQTVPHIQPLTRRTGAQTAIHDVSFDMHRG
jgi:hypothetical protein